VKTTQVSVRKRRLNTLDAIAKIFCEATKEVLERSTGAEIRYSPTIQVIPQVQLKPEIGCFVQFTGDYSGLMVMNFTGEAAMTIYKHSMLFMGLPEDELATEYTSEDVVNNTGELINQIIGKARQKVEQKYSLSAFNSQPKAIALTNSIILNIAGLNTEKDKCRRLSFKIQGYGFHIELSMEQTEFLSIDGDDLHQKSDQKEEESPKILDFDEILKNSLG
jgi:CheY-specific phosphatase CheX